MRHLTNPAAEDYIESMRKVLELFKKEKEFMKLLVKNHLIYIYIDHINKTFINNFSINNLGDKYKSALYSGALVNLNSCDLKMIAKKKYLI